MGAFEATELVWKPSNISAGSFSLTTQFKAYESFIVFEQRNGAEISEASSGNKDGVSTVFPSFKAVDLQNSRRGALTYDGDMVGSGYRTLEWSSTTNHVPSGVSGTAPIVIFDESLDTTAVISPAYNFMAANQYFSQGDACLQYGVMGNVSSLPAGFTIQTIVSFSSNGINNAMMEWGDVLLNKYGKDRNGVEKDFTLNYLGYSTDNGAYYYYYTEPNKTYEDTILDIHAYAAEAGIPYRHWLADSWWYYKGTGDGVKNWTGMGSIFPHGLDYVYNSTGWPVVGHNRYWSDNTDYAIQNGGEYEFAIDPSSKHALPLTQRFWDYLMESSRKWGLYTYEQDWLDDEYDRMSPLQTNATLARTWLMQMGTAAEKHGLTIQYCMSHSRHMMQSLELPAVTQARASGDYSQSNSDQWRPIGTTAMFAWAIGVAPSKDNFWTTWNKGNAQANPRYHGRDGEPYNRLQALVSTLSRGPVTPSDQNGHSDTALILRSCMADGRLLQLSRPAFVLDLQLQNSALGSDDLSSAGKDSELWAGFSRVAGSTYGVFFGARLSNVFNVTPSMVSAGFPVDFAWVKDAKLLAFETNSTSSVLPFAEGAPLALVHKSDSPWDFTFHSISPVLGNGWTLIGEQDKWVSVSANRFKDVTTLANGLVVKLSGAPKEIVNVSFFPPNSASVVVVSCEVGQDSTVKLVISGDLPAGKCATW